MNLFTQLAVRSFFCLMAPLLAFVVCSHAALGQAACDEPATEVVSVITLPASPFGVVAAKDGCTVFVSMNASGKGHVGVLTRAGGKMTLAHDVTTDAQSLAGLALGANGKVLTAANNDGVILFDTAKLMAGDGTPLVRAADERRNPKQPSGAVYVAISPNDKLLFVSDERTASITVYDFADLKAGATKALGRISVGEAPVGLVFSPDGKRLYTTSEEARDRTAPATCPSPTGAGAPNRPEGVLTVVDVARAESAPPSAVLAKLSGGCDPVRIALSRDGSRAYVTTRNANALRVYDTAKMVSDADHALLATIPVGKAPVGVLLAGEYLVTSDSNRFGPSGRKSEWLSVIDPASNHVLGNVPAGLFPREMAVTSDGKTLIVTNTASNSLQLVDLTRLTPDYFAEQKSAKEAADSDEVKIASALQARIAAKQASPGTETALRKLIASIKAKSPIYDELTPTLAANVRATAEQVEKRLDEWGALQSVIFLRVTPQNADVFEVDFEHQKTRWTIVVAPDGKIGPVGFGPLAPGSAN